MRDPSHKALKKVMRPDLAEEDYENSTMAYVELHGGAVACVKGSSNDLVSDPSANLCCV